jgi:hypothetical protein
VLRVLWIPYPHKKSKNSPAAAPGVPVAALPAAFLTQVVIDSCVASPGGWHVRCGLIATVVNESQIISFGDCLP